MKLDSARVLITGGAGGIGRAIAVELLRHGACVLLADRDARSLRAAKLDLAAHADRLDTIEVDLASPVERERLCEFARSWRGGLEILINNAGLNDFGLFEEQSARHIERALAINVQAPLHLCQELLPALKARRQACIVNTGSIFGAIGYPGYAIYSATKFALRGFTEALRRELAGTRVSVHYIAPRATRTGINGSAVEHMNAELGVAMDSPRRVAEAVVMLIRTGRPTALIGWPEKLFVRLNALLPAVVDRAIRRQLPVIEKYARRQPT
jgi:short-subunit dehydrogenase